MCSFALIYFICEKRRIRKNSKVYKQFFEEGSKPLDEEEDEGEAIDEEPG